MGCIVTVDQDIWYDEVHLRAPGASGNAVYQAVHHALREFAKQSGAWIVELWDDDGSGNPIPFNLPPETPYFDFQQMLEAFKADIVAAAAADPVPLGNDSFDLSWNIAAAANTPYPSCDPADPWTENPPIDAYWPWDILYFKTVAYFDEYTHDPDPSKKTRKATRFLTADQTQHFRAAGGSEGSSTGGPRNFHTLNIRPGAMELYPSLDINLPTSGVVPWVSLGFPRIPVNNAVPVIFERYWYEHILDGAVGRLCSQQDKPYTNAVLAKYHLTRFRNGISEAREVAERQFNPTERGWGYNQWA